MLMETTSVFAGFELKCETHPPITNDWRQLLWLV